MRALTLHLLLAKFFRICRLTDSWMFLQSAVSPAILQIKVTALYKTIHQQVHPGKTPRCPKPSLTPKRATWLGIIPTNTHTHALSLFIQIVYLHSAQNTLDGCVLHSHTDTLSVTSIIISPHEAAPVEAIPPCYDTFHRCHKPHIYIRMTTCPGPPEAHYWLTNLFILAISAGDSSPGSARSR